VKCSECVRLLQEFAAAQREYVALVSHLINTDEEPIEPVRSVEALIATAKINVDRAMLEIQKHRHETHRADTAG